MGGVTKKGMKPWWFVVGSWMILASLVFPEIEFSGLFLLGMIFIIRGTT